MMFDRRMFLKGLAATAAGVLVPGAVLAEPERRIWALDRTMAPAPTHTIALISATCDYRGVSHIFDDLFATKTIHNLDGTYTYVVTGVTNVPPDVTAALSR